MDSIHLGSAAAARPIVGAIRAAAVREHKAEPFGPSPSSPPFITISREGGAGAWTVAKRLVEYLNGVDPGERPWTAWDKELVEKVAADNRISAAVVESLGERGISWLEELLGGLKVTTHQPSQLEVYWRVAATIRGLATMGRAVIVGRGGAFITRAMPRGVHVRLIAPLQQRIEFMAKMMNASLQEAAAKVHEMDHNRAAFFRRHWPGRALSPEAFTLTLNTAGLDEDRIVRCISALVPIEKDVCIC